MSAVGIVRQHLAAAIAEGKAAGQGADFIGRQMIDAVIAEFLKTRSIDDIQRELQFIVDTIDPDTDFVFMRP